MYYNLLWIFLLILHTFVTSMPVGNRYDIGDIGIDPKPDNAPPELPNYRDASDSGNKQVISVRITSSVAVGRGKEKLPYRPHHHQHVPEQMQSPDAGSRIGPEEDISDLASHLTSGLAGANIEYIKQLNAKKDTRDHHTDPVHPFESMVHEPIENESPQSEFSAKHNEYDDHLQNIPTARKIPSAADINQFNKHEDRPGYQLSAVIGPMDFYNENSPMTLTTKALLEPSEKFGMRINMGNNENIVNNTTIDKRIDIEKLRDLRPFVSNDNNYETDDSVAESSIKSIEFAKTTAAVSSAASYIHSSSNRRLINEQKKSRLTTVSFNIVHDATKSNNDDEQDNSYVAPSEVAPSDQKPINNSPKIYSEPAKIYSVPAKFYSEPAKIYSEPAKIYSEPAKVYSEPAKIYSEPAKFYSEPASLHLNENIPNMSPSVPPNYSPWQSHQPIDSTTINTTPVTTITNGFQVSQMEHQPERNYEVDEKISVLTDGKSHGVQESTEKCKQDNCKVGYVVEGRQFKKYRVEERTADGFIVGEYGVVRNEDGALRGVRYTADSDASPRLIHDALMKFLQLK